MPRPQLRGWVDLTRPCSLGLERVFVMQTEPPATSLTLFFSLSHEVRETDAERSGNLLLSREVGINLAPLNPSHVATRQPGGFVELALCPTASGAHDANRHPKRPP